MKEKNEERNGKKNEQKKRKEFSYDETENEEEQKKVELGPHGFLLYSDKYNPRPSPIPKSPVMSNFVAL